MFKRVLNPLLKNIILHLFKKKKKKKKKNSTRKYKIFYLSKTLCSVFKTFTTLHDLVTASTLKSMISL